MAEEPKLKKGKILSIMDDPTHPFWTAKQLANEAGVSHVTATDRLKELDEEELIASGKASNANLYYRPGLTIEEPREERGPIEADLIREFENRFVGLDKEPWTAVSTDREPATAGDKVYLVISGQLGNWRILTRYPYDDPPEKIRPNTMDEGSIQAVLSGKLYSEPTVPLRHKKIRSGFDLEGSTGSKYDDIGSADRPLLVAVGPKNYLIRPCNNAVFLQDVEVDQIWPVGEGRAHFMPRGEEVVSEPERHQGMQEAFAKEVLEEMEEGGFPEEEDLESR